MTEVRPRRSLVGAPDEVCTVALRPLRTAGEYAAAVALQGQTWGPRYHELVPPSLQMLTQRLGGVVSGAFDPGGALVGFVFGMTGLMDGRLVHWSHMLAVAETHRNAGIGRRLKEHQRALLRGSGVAEIRWTFDPLVARNGHLNLHVLGTRVLDYVVDAYGDTGSDLHAFGTDRFVVSWPVSGDGVATGAPTGHAPGAAGVAGAAGTADGAGAAAGTLDGADVPLVNSPPGDPAPAADDAWDAAEVGVQVPAEVEILARVNLPLARAWRASTRQAFRGALSRGYRVVGFTGVRGEPGRYLLRRPAP
jgi:predicted GNAT superfamily acetyltransferase